MHLKFHSFLVNSDKFKNTTITFNKISSYEVFYRFIDFLMTYLYKTDLYDNKMMHFAVLNCFMEIIDIN